MEQSVQLNFLINKKKAFKKTHIYNEPQKISTKLILIMLSFRSTQLKETLPI